MARATCWLLLWGYLAAGVQSLRPKLQNIDVSEDSFNPPIANWKFNPRIPQLEQLETPRTGRIAAAQADPSPANLPASSHSLQQPGTDCGRIQPSPYQILYLFITQLSSN